MRNRHKSKDKENQRGYVMKVNEQLENIVLYMIIISYVTFFYYDDVAVDIAILQDF